MSELIRVICANIREAQKNEGLTPSELAEKYGLCPNDIDQNEWNITMQTLEKIAQELEISPINLLEVEKLEADEQHLNKQDKLRVLLNIMSEFNEQEISRVINIVQEIKRMQK